LKPCGQVIDAVPLFMGERGQLGQKLSRPSSDFRENFQPTDSFSFYPLADQRTGPARGKTSNNTFRQTFDKNFFEKSFAGLSLAANYSVSTNISKVR
jgi:hypothetical protein